ncbi:shikimate dehydrogenase [Rhodopirellula sp. JC740]|uniref:Multifunctional fusion protein n=1 Tax=Rhodopirellula halodulae TaxID=2894198 RepID=A0ABS8NCZ4_9BACT|nr:MULTISPECIES: shikimate dehydrogenase [unclassified Rhodopirellula]MCC9641423.1 shikimate dehydrogenase [Rhodopirellula sp. JC740]MCC9657831.1 shikimate dehydrogenase [Rhodopirellula sp. JC737]
MICVSLGRARHKRMIAEHQYLVEQGAQLVELRLDYISRAVDLKRLLNDRPGPVVATVRRKEDGGRWERSEQDRMMLLRSTIAAGVEYVDIEADVAAQIPRYGDTKRIISYHDFSGTPENLEELHEAMAAEDADIVKIACMANSFSDNIRMINLCKNSKIPTIGICMGEIGMLTRILANRVGSPFTYATFSTDKKLAPGQLNWKEMNSIYHYETIKEDTALFGVIADPVAHSHSPLIHNAAFVDAGLNARYLPLRIPKDDLQSFMNTCSSIGIQGISITIPHKEAALQYCTQAESSCTGIGAINTMIFNGDERLGYNTDYRAAMDCIEEAFKIQRGTENSMQGKTALILGAGGVSRAIAWGLRQRKCDVTIASRTRERAEMLAADIGCRVVDWEERHDTKVQLLVNGTPIGMHPDVDNTPYNQSALNQFMVVFDTVYNPENTLLIKQAKQKQSRVITGVDMFVRQAAYQYKLFTGQEASTELMRKKIKEATNPVQLN